MQPGEVVQLGRHRLMCGDATNPEHVGTLMEGEKAVLLHADPPYGMGKAIANDNLYRDKLDRFQMAWWQACRPSLADNGSAYIWGRAEDLWRLWFTGGLRDSERLTLRNEIVWAKGSAGAGGISHMGADGLRLYPQETERCLFFMLGEQGFSSNADNYWEGFEPIRSYLYAQRHAMGWTSHDMKRLAGGAPNGFGDHWTGRGQWSMPTEEAYRRWQAEADGRAFLRSYDSLRREWYATRAYFDNTHDTMTDVWRFPSVKGSERWGHPTPKPVAMLERICQSSAPVGGLILDPMAGSGPMVIAAENTGRRCFALELDGRYCDTIIERYEKLAAQPRLIA